MQKLSFIVLLGLILLFVRFKSSAQAGSIEIPKLVICDSTEGNITLNGKASGFNGIWYMNQPTNDEYAYKYSGGLGTYSAKHQPIAVYDSISNRTFFSFGGVKPEKPKELLHMVSYYDHATGKVARPTIILNKQTENAHDNPVISVDKKGYIWIFSTSHGTIRTSYLHKSVKPRDISEFSRICAVIGSGDEKKSFDNFSYAQIWNLPKKKFFLFYSRYQKYDSLGNVKKMTDEEAGNLYRKHRDIGFSTSDNGKKWKRWVNLAAFGEGHYQITGAYHNKVSSTFNFHPEFSKRSGKQGLNYRSNLYYIESVNGGRTWQNIEGEKLDIPLREIQNKALVYNYYKEGLNVYLKDITFDHKGNPLILYITSNGYESGPKNNPRTWTTAYWTDKKWQIRPITTSDNNYDMGSIYVDTNGDWVIMAPSAQGPQHFNPGGEMVLWVSRNEGITWDSLNMTSGSTKNHNYARHPRNVHPDFYAIWADGHGREPSTSSFYFANRAGSVFKLPEVMIKDMERPVPVTIN